MSISARNIFNYDSLLSKRIQLDNREYQIRQKERDLLGQALMQRNTQPDQQAALIRSQRFFELGFEEGFKRAQAGETEVPDLGGLFSIFAGALIRGNVRAKGGPVKKGEPYVVGEKGPELIVPSESGNVIPNDEVSPYFEAFIGREDARNLKSNIVTESFFDTGKGRFPVTIGECFCITIMIIRRLLHSTTNHLYLITKENFTIRTLYFI